MSQVLMFNGKTNKQGLVLLNLSLLLVKKARSSIGLRAFFVCVLLCNTAFAAGEYPSRLWKITHTERNVAASYLLGTMHLADKAIVNLPPHISKVVDAADSLVLELKLNAETQKTLASLSMLQGDLTLSDLIGDDYFFKVSKVLASRGLATRGIQRLKPWAVGLMLNFPKASLDPVLDYALHLKFKKMKKPVYQLETANEQVEIFNSMPLKDQIGFLKFSLMQQSSFDENLAKMKQLYLSDDLDALQAFSDSQMLDTNEPYLKGLFKALIDDRNIKMLNRMEFYLRSGNSLIAVGALHLTGDKGLVKLLRLKGYTVEPVLQ